MCQIKMQEGMVKWMIDIVVTMGGLGTRFRKKGYTVPKYMIEARGKTLFEWSMISLTDCKERTARYIFIALDDDDNDVETFISEKCRDLGIVNYYTILLDSLTDGQATTAMKAEKYWNADDALLIYNIDTYVEAGEIKSDDFHGDGFIPCFKASGTHWSFVRLDECGKVVEIKEKQRISDYCTIGAYYFRTCSLYKKLYDEFYDQKGYLINGEKYVAPLYDYLLSINGDVYISDISPDKVHVLGTPEELDVFLNGY